MIKCTFLLLFIHSDLTLTFQKHIMFCRPVDLKSVNFYEELDRLENFQKKRTTLNSQIFVIFLNKIYSQDYVIF